MSQPKTRRSPFTEILNTRILQEIIFVTSLCCACICIENKMAAEFDVEKASDIVETEAASTGDKLRLCPM